MGRRITLSWSDLQTLIFVNQFDDDAFDTPPLGLTADYDQAHKFWDRVDGIEKAQKLADQCNKHTGFGPHAQFTVVRATHFFTPVTSKN